MKRLNIRAAKVNGSKDYPEKVWVICPVRIVSERNYRKLLAVVNAARHARDRGAVLAGAVCQALDALERPADLKRGDV